VFCTKTSGLITFFVRNFAAGQAANYPIVLAQNIQMPEKGLI